MTAIASVFVEMLPETSKIGSGLRRAFRDADPIAAEAGRRWGNEIERGIGTVKVDLDADTSKARAEIDAMARDKRVTVKVDVDRSNLDRLLDGGGGSGGLGGTGALKLNVSLVGIGALPAAATAITEVAGALQQLAGAGLAIPGVFAGVAASVSTAVLGMSGMKDAWDAASKAADSSGVDQAAQAKAVADAQRSLTDATISQDDAQRDLSSAWKDARQQLDDLNLSLNGGKISEAQAYNDLLKARRDLARGGFKDRLDYNDAVLRVESSEQRWEESKQRNVELQAKANDANAKGVAGSDLVVNAQERVVRANNQAAGAQQNLADAQSKTSTAAKSAADAMAKLSPNAAQTVQTLIGLKSTFIDLRNVAGQNMFAGVSAGIKDLVSADLPALNRGVDSISRGLNQNILQAMKSLSSSDSQGFLSRILGNTGDAQSRLTAAIDPIIHAVGVLTAAGSDTLPRLATAVGAVADRFNSFITAADGDGRLDKWIKEGLDGFTSLGNIALNLGKSFTGLTQAAGGGAGLLGNIQALTEKWQLFLNSTAGQERLKQFFADGRNMLGQLRDVAAQLLPLLPQVFNAAHDAANFWLPVIREALQIINSIPGGAQAVVTAFVAWKTISGVASLASSLTNVANLLKITLPAAAVSGAGGVTAALAPLAAAGGPILAIGAAIATATEGLYKLRDLVAEKDATGDRSLGDLLFGKNMNDALAPAAPNGGGGNFGSPGYGASADPSWKPVLQPNQPPGTYRRRDGSQGTIPRPVDAAPQAAIQPAAPSSNSTSASGAGVPGSVGADKLTPNAENLQSVIRQMFPEVKDIGGYRAPDGYNEHSSGQALDIMVGTNKALGDQINQFLLKNAAALGIQYDLWQQTQWNPDGTSSGMEDRGGATANHRDHVHARVKPGPAAGGAVSAPAPAVTAAAAMPAGPIAPIGPTGGANDPYFTKYPDGYQPPGPDMGQLGQSLGGDMSELFLPDGFKNPAELGGVKLMTGFLSGLLGMKMPAGGGSIMGGDGAALPGMGAGGGGGDIFSTLMQSVVPQPIGALKVGGMDGPLPSTFNPQPGNTPGPGNGGGDYSININNPIGQGHLEGMINTATTAQIPRARQGMRPLP